jgi:vitamin B12 transporter
MSSRTLAGKLSLIALASVSELALASIAHAQQPVAVELPGIEVTAPSKPRRASQTTGGTERATVATTSSNVQPQEAVVSPSAIVTPNENVASSVTVITGQELQQQQRRTVPDALQSVPGLNVVQTGGPGGLTSVFMRGTNSNQVKVLIDGIDASDPSSPAGAFDFGQLTTGDVARIEVLRGPQSGLYGADAVGGVISIITKKGEGPAKVTGYVEGGSFGTFNQAAGVSGSEGRFNYAFNATHLRSMNTPVTPSDALLPGERANDNTYDNQTYSTRLGYDFSRRFEVNFVARYTDAKLGYTADSFPPPLYSGVPNALRSYQDFQQFLTRGEAVWSPFGDVFKNYFSVAYNDVSRSSIDPTSTSAARFDGDRIKADWRGVITLAPGQTIMLGLEQQKDSAKTSAIDTDESNRAAYVEFQSQIARQFFLNANVRYDDNEVFGGHETWRIAPAYIVPGTNTKLKGSIGTAFKAPTLNQRYDPTYGNAGLLPEESTGWDVGFEQPFLNEKIRVGLTYFHNDITNLIQNIPFFPYSYENVGQATTKGYEAFAAFQITTRLSLRADYTYTDAFDDDTGERLLRRPRHKLGGTVLWQPTDPLTLSTTVIFLGDRMDFGRYASSASEAPDYTLVNLAAEYKLNDRVAVFGRIDNLLDEKYQDPLGWERPGFGVYGGLRFTSR